MHSLSYFMFLLGNFDLNQGFNASSVYHFVDSLVV